jgi:hypothetical protein
MSEETKIVLKESNDDAPKLRLARTSDGKINPAIRALAELVAKKAVKTLQQSRADSIQSHDQPT